MGGRVEVCFFSKKLLPHPKSQQPLEFADILSSLPFVQGSRHDKCRVLTYKVVSFRLQGGCENFPYFKVIFHQAEISILIIDVNNISTVCIYIYIIATFIYTSSLLKTESNRHP